MSDGNEVTITARWDEEFGKREPGSNAIFLMAGPECLAYIVKRENGASDYMAFMGAGMGGWLRCASDDLQDCKDSVASHYAAISKGRAI